LGDRKPSVFGASVKNLKILTLRNDGWVLTTATILATTSSFALIDLEGVALPPVVPRSTNVPGRRLALSTSE
jgi:hypothetical protein